ncbi:hypothetical protein V7S43_004153 [Phytophthora oleae]|uniref:BHLH domain-containing protein n=1 Tax=Phytophthora oleae TaxID=2107226 RepID=A0ABD3FVM1_9STRA
MYAVRGAGSGPLPMQLAAKPKKKRVRRQKLEIEYLRKLVPSLEEQVSELKPSRLPSLMTRRAQQRVQRSFRFGREWQNDS